MPEINKNNAHLFDGYTFEQKVKLYEALTDLYSENKRNLFDSLVQNRTRHVCVMVEDIYQSHNASAVLRSCDCFGVQDVHVVEQHNKFCPNSEVAMGSNKWVDVYKYKQTLDAYDTLRKKGYQIIATTPHENDSMIGQLDITKPTCLVFGTELTGLTQEAIDHADGYVKIPMYGFTESFNISVCAALSLFSVTERMRQLNVNWQMTEEEQLTLKLYWSLQVIKDGTNVLRTVKERIGL
ncbi:MAG: RNA methyltransferase [Bacteroidales bacterium]|nr:RNA methyltransferase [Bacteroidales bacterium]